MLRTIAVAITAATALSACSTMMTEAPPTAAEPPPAYSASINVQNVNGSAAGGVRAPAGTAQALIEALRTEFAQAPQEGPAANLVFTIADYRAAGRRTRGKANAPAGERMTVKVSITTPKGTALRQFQVNRAVETGAAGTAAERRARLVAETAQAIAKAVRGEAPPS